ncbi:hypothetical protein M0802_009423 [Mischocyttarus mexicanus]|nr:hypothetical protein M0802_009423 [Mischocyttarus mexicanus]
MATSVDSNCTLYQFSPKDFHQQPEILLSDQDLRYIVSRKLRGNNNFNVLKMSMLSVESTSGYMGQYYNIRVTVKLEDSSTKKFDFFAKIPPSTDNPQYNYILKYDTFNKEIIFYTDMIRRMGAGKGFKWFVECYLCKKDSIIILENVKIEGYTILDKHIPFDEEHCSWTMKALSKFHSRSLILDEKLRRTGRTILDLYGHLLHEILYTKDDFSKKGMNAAIIGIFATIDLIDTLNDEEKISLKKRVNTWTWALPNLLKPSNKYRNVLCHRDIWSNNIMFKHDSNGTPLGCYLIDFQLMRYYLPAMDVVCCLYLTTDRATRDRHSESLMKIYHDTMRQSLQDEGLNADKCLSWSEFRESCDEVKPIALFYALMNLQIMLMPTKATEQFMESPDIFEEVIYGEKRSDLIQSQYREVEPYRNRLREIVLETFEILPDQPTAI